MQNRLASTGPEDLCERSGQVRTAATMADGFGFPNNATLNKKHCDPPEMPAAG
jgi:hypothetical protein